METRPWTQVTGGANLRVKVKDLAYVRHKCIKLSQIKTKMIIGSFCTCHQIHVTSGNLSLLQYLICLSVTYFCSLQNWNLESSYFLTQVSGDVILRSK